MLSRSLKPEGDFSYLCSQKQTHPRQHLEGSLWDRFQQMDVFLGPRAVRGTYYLPCLRPIVITDEPPTVPPPICAETA